MKIRARANGDVIDVPEDAATVLLEAGIYELLEGQEASTKTDPMSTKESPLLKKKVR